MKDIEDEIPFEVPEGWAWCRLPSLCRKPITDGTHNSPPNSVEGDFLYITAKNIKLSGISLEDVTYVSKEVHDEIFSRCAPEFGDVLLTKDGTIGEATVNNLNYPFSMLSSVALIKPSNWLLSWYLVYVLKSSHFQKQMKGNAKGSALKRIILAQINSFLIPFPPIEEQKQIVTKIEEIFSQINCLENGKDELQTAIKHAKSKILDLAIHGKLVPQDPSEETAGKLLERIRAEKEAKIAAGELKRDKNDSYIYKNPSDNCHYRKYANGQEECIESEIAFSLPDSWQWVNLGGVFSHNTGKALNKSKLEGEYKDYITTSNVYWDKFELNNVSKMPFTPEEMKKCTVTKGDLLICEGGDVGRSNIWDKDYDICIQNHLHRLRAFVPVETKLFYFWLMLFKQRNMIVGKGIGLMGFSSSLVHNLLVPLPPLSEQKRIVSKIEEIFSNLDEILENLS